MIVSFENVRSFFRVDELAKRFDMSNQKLLYAAYFFMIALLIGFLIRRHIRDILLCSLAVAAALILLQGFDLISIDWFYIRTLTGIDPQTTLGGLFSQFIVLIKSNVVATLAIVVGFFIGYKIG
jgi:uncharacterized membrane protein (Fun14 family)